MDISSILSQFSFGPKAQDAAGAMRPAGVEGPLMANGSFSTPPVNMWELLGNSGLQGAMAGRGDYRGIAGMLEANERTKIMQQRTAMDQQDLQMRQETHRAQMDLDKRRQESSAKIQELFADPEKVANDLPGTMLKALPHMISAGDTRGAHDVFGLLAKAGTDQKAERDMAVAAMIYRNARDKDNKLDIDKFEQDIGALANPGIMKAADAFRPYFTMARQERTEERLQKQQQLNEEERKRDNIAAESRFQQGQAATESRFIRGQAAADERQAKNQAAITDRIMQRPVEQGDREAIGAMQENLRVAQELKNGFTPEERQRYVGFLKNPAQRVAQIAKNDPRFARFQTLTNEVKGFAFAEGGKNLTSTEKQITWGHLPVGTEFSVADYVSNLDRTIERTGSLVDRRINLATSPRSALREQLGKDQYTGPNVNAPKGGGVIRNTSKSGKPIISKDGGKTWEYE